jgi:hypothetical protein
LLDLAFSFSCGLGVILVTANTTIRGHLPAGQGGQPYADISTYLIVLFDRRYLQPDINLRLALSSLALLDVAGLSNFLKMALRFNGALY